MNIQMTNEEYIEFLNTINTLPDKEREIIKRGVLQLNDDKKQLLDVINGIIKPNIKNKKIINNNTMVNINGKCFYCTCGANVFTQYEDNTFKCHACEAEYEGQE